MASFKVLHVVAGLEVLVDIAFACVQSIEMREAATVHLQQLLSQYLLPADRDWEGKIRHGQGQRPMMAIAGCNGPSDNSNVLGILTCNRHAVWAKDVMLGMRPVAVSSFLTAVQQLSSFMTAVQQLNNVATWTDTLIVSRDHPAKGMLTCGTERLNGEKLAFLHLCLLSTLHNGHAFAAMYLVLPDGVAVEVANTLDWIGFAVQLNLMGLHHFLHSCSHVAQPHIYARLLHPCSCSQLPERGREGGEEREGEGGGGGGAEREREREETGRGGEGGRKGEREREKEGGRGREEGEREKEGDGRKGGREGGRERGSERASSRSSSSSTDVDEDMDEDEDKTRTRKGTELCTQKGGPKRCVCRVALHFFMTCHTRTSAHRGGQRACVGCLSHCFQKRIILGVECHCECTVDDAATDLGAKICKAHSDSAYMSKSPDGRFHTSDTH